MSALTPKNQKYRRSWKTFGAQVIISEAYKHGYDQINWGEGSKDLEREEQSLPGHYIIRVRTDQ